MAFTMKALPSSLCLSHKALSVEPHARASYRLPTGAYYARIRPSIRCSSTQVEGESSGNHLTTQVEEEASGNRHHEEAIRGEPVASSPVLLQEEATPDSFAGWEPLPPESKGSWKSALLQVGAGFVLAIGFGLLGFTTYQKIERRLKPPLPVATQQQHISPTSELESPGALKDEPSYTEGSKTFHTDAKAKDNLQNETEKSAELKADIHSPFSSLKEEEKEKSSQAQASSVIKDSEESDLGDEEAVSSSAFDHDEDTDFQQKTSTNKFTKDESELASSRYLDESSKLMMSGSNDKVNENADEAFGSGSTGAVPDGRPVSRDGVLEVDLSAESDYTKASTSESGGISRIVIPELTEQDRIFEIVLVSTDGSNINKGQKHSDITETQEDKEQITNPDVSTERVNVSEHDPSSVVRETEVSSLSAATVKPETNKNASKESSFDSSESPLAKYSNFETNEGALTEIQPEKYKPDEVNTVTLSQDSGDRTRSATSNETFEANEKNESEISNVDASSAWVYSSFYAPAPSSPCAAVQVHTSKVVVPAMVEQTQELALKALQTLEVVDSEVDPGAICTRREYARWLIASSLKLARSPGHKIYPAMYIEDITELAFDDVPLGDPDFPSIQGLAEAGLIASNLSGGESGQDYGAVFKPDSFLSRQDLVTWKVALDRRELPSIDKETLQEVSGFIDVDRVHKNARPALMADLVSEEHSIIASAFGFTRRFQPDKPTTIGQAAIALTSGEAADVVAEELARAEAEAMATQAVVDDIATEVRAHRELDGNVYDEVNVEKARREQAEKLIDELRVELEQIKAERDAEKFSYLKGRATVDSEKDILQTLRQQVDRQSKELSALQAKVAGEKERFEKLRLDREAELEAVSRLKAELGVEKRALELVRIWAEDEAKQARVQGKILEEARRRWEGQGFEVDSDLEEALNPDSNTLQTEDVRTKLDSIVQQVVPRYNEPTSEDVAFKTQVNDVIINSWQSMKTEDARVKLEKLLQQVIPQQEPTAEDVEFKTQVNDAVVNSWRSSTQIVTGQLHKVIKFIEDLLRKAHHVQETTMSSAGQRVQEVKAAAGEQIQGIQGKLGDSTQGFQEIVGERAEEVKATVAGMSTNFVEGSKQVSSNLREGAEKFAQRFRN